MRRLPASTHDDLVERAGSGAKTWWLMASAREVPSLLGLATWRLLQAGFAEQ
jgi:hypothetical protein